MKRQTNIIDPRDSIRVYVDPSLRRAIERAAKAADRSLSNEVMRTLKRVYEAAGETRKVDNGS